MIKSIEIDYPKFGDKGLKVKREFTKGINIIEEKNGFGKSSILYTISSLYSGKYINLRTLPDGFTIIETDKSKCTLSKKSWIGRDFEANELYEFCMPGKFFDLASTVKQREVLVKLLGLNYDTFIIDKVIELMDPESEDAQFNIDYYSYLKNYTPGTEKEMNQLLKQFESDENIILEDITRYKAEIINFQKKDFPEVKKFYDDQTNIKLKVADYNSSLKEKQNELNIILSDIRILENNIYKFKNDLINENNNLKSLTESVEKLRLEYDNTTKGINCSRCNQSMPQAQISIVLEDIKNKGLKGNADIKLINTKIIKLIEDIKTNEDLLVTKNKLKDSFVSPEYISLDDIQLAAKKVGIEYKGIPEELFNEYNEYNTKTIRIEFITKELEIKEKKLNEINTIKLKDNIDKLKEFKRMFTEKLLLATKSLPVQIVLFEKLKNGEEKETFSINYKGIDYFDLSHGNKMLVQLMMANIFVEHLGLDFILCDEGNSISKDNLEYIKELSKTKQVIIAKATGWNNKDLI